MWNTSRNCRLATQRKTLWKRRWHIWCVTKSSATDTPTFSTVLCATDFEVSHHNFHRRAQNCQRRRNAFIVAFWYRWLEEVRVNTQIGLNLSNYLPQLILMWVNQLWLFSRIARLWLVLLFKICLLIDLYAIPGTYAQHALWIRKWCNDRY